MYENKIKFRRATQLFVQYASGPKESGMGGWVARVEKITDTEQAWGFTGAFVLLIQTEVC